MRLLPAAVAAHLDAGGAWYVENLVRLRGRNRATNAYEEIRLWTGSDHRQITVEGTPHLHYGVGAIIAFGPVVERAAFEVRERQITLSPLAPAVVQAIRVYESRFALIEIWDWHLDPETGNALAPPVRDFRGQVVAAPIREPEKGGTASCEITAVSGAWQLTKGLTLKRSDAALQARSPGDRFRRYNDISGVVTTVWGEHEAKGPPGAAPKPVAPVSPVDEKDWGP